MYDEKGRCSLRMVSNRKVRETNSANEENRREPCQLQKLCAALGLGPLCNKLGGLIVSGSGAAGCEDMAWGL